MLLMLVSIVSLDAFSQARSSAASSSRFVFGNAANYDTLDPHVTMDHERIAPRINLYDGLLRWLDSPAKLEPWLAEKFVAEKDSSKFTFTLRKGAKFHDGTDVKAADVVYSVERLLALKQGPAPLLAEMIAPGSTRAPDDQTVVFNLTHPSATFLSVVPEIAIVNASLVKKFEFNNDWGAAWLAKNEAGSGSYMLSRYDPKSGFTAERFNDHWNSKWGAKPIETIEFRTVVEPERRMLGLIDGDLTGIDGYLPGTEVRRLKEIKTLQVVEAESQRLFYGVLQYTREPMNDLTFRTALSYTFDYDRFLSEIGVAPGQRNPLPLPAGTWGAPKGVKGFTFDIDKARLLLTEVARPAKPLVIAAIEGDLVSLKAAEILKNGMETLGVSGTVVVSPWSTLVDQLQDEKQAPDIAFIWRGMHYPDPGNWLGEMFDCDLAGSRNLSRYCNKAIDAVLKDGRFSIDAETRRKSYERAATMLVEDAAGLFIHVARWRGVYSMRVKGIRPSPGGNGQDMRWASME